MIRHVPLLAFAITLAVPALAQNVRSAVSVNGNDAAACTVADPCRTFGAALARTNPGGEIITLTSGGYFPFVIDRSISILSPAGIHTAVAPTSGNAIRILAANTDSVTIRGLFLNGMGGTDGIDARSASAIYVENTVIQGFTNSGFTLFAEGNPNVSLRDMAVRGNSGGIHLTGLSGGSGFPVRVSLHNVRVEQTASSPGVAVSDRVHAAITSSLITGGAQSTGLFVAAGGFAALRECVVAGNNIGISTQGGLILVGNTMITGNDAAIVRFISGSITSFGDNQVSGNGSSEAFTINIGRQ